MYEDIRWKQRLQNYNKALAQLTEAVNYASNHELSNLEQQGLIKAFEFTFELSWNVMKDYLSMMGITGIIGSRDAIRQAFKAGLISQGQIWMFMIDDRNLSSHTYSGEIKDILVNKIVKLYYHEFLCFAEKMAEL